MAVSHVEGPWGPGCLTVLDGPEVTLSRDYHHTILWGLPLGVERYGGYLLLRTNGSGSCSRVNSLLDLISSTRGISGSRCVQQLSLYHKYSFLASNVYIGYKYCIRCHTTFVGGGYTSCRGGG